MGKFLWTVVRSYTKIMYAIIYLWNIVHIDDIIVVIVIGKKDYTIFSANNLCCTIISMPSNSIKFQSNSNKILVNSIVHVE